VVLHLPAFSDADRKAPPPQQPEQAAPAGSASSSNAAAAAGTGAGAAGQPRPARSGGLLACLCPAMHAAESRSSPGGVTAQPAALPQPPQQQQSSPQPAPQPAPPHPSFEWDPLRQPPQPPDGPGEPGPAPHDPYGDAAPFGLGPRACPAGSLSLVACREVRASGNGWGRPPRLLSCERNKRGPDHRSETGAAPRLRPVQLLWRDAAAVLCSLSLSPLAHRCACAWPSQVLCALLKAYSVELREPERWGAAAGPGAWFRRCDMVPTIQLPDGVGLLLRRLTA
jgi:hypothetical protein